MIKCGQAAWKPKLLFGSVFGTIIHEPALLLPSSLAAGDVVRFRWEEDLEWRQYSIPVELNYTAFYNEKIRWQWHLGAVAHWTHYHHQLDLNVYYPGQSGVETPETLNYKNQYFALSTRLGTSFSYQWSKNWSWTSKLTTDYYFLPTSNICDQNGAWGLLLQTGIRYTW